MNNKRWNDINKKTIKIDLLLTSIVLFVSKRFKISIFPFSTAMFSAAFLNTQIRKHHSKNLLHWIIL